MSSEVLKAAKLETKAINKVPKGATIIQEEVSITIKEIENGFLIRKNYDIKYQVSKEKSTDYLYYTKEWYTKENPMSIDMKAISEKSLAEKMD